jgi:hypothetical protein
MRPRESTAWLVLAAASAGIICWLGLGSFGWNDYRREALPAIDALVHWHMSSFFVLAPVYGGSLLERAPFAFFPSLWGGGELAVYRMLAVPCLLASGALGLWLVARMRRAQMGHFVPAFTLVLFVANPTALTALESGHPEELLGTVLCLTAVLLAARARPILGGLALGLALANKEWALIAVGPVLMALPYRRTLCMLVTGAVGAALFAPFTLFAPSAFGSAVRSAASPTSAIFLPSQLWWFLGRPMHDGYRTAASWIGPISHPLIVAIGVPLTLAALLALRRCNRAESMSLAGASTEPPSREAHALLLLALLFALRFMLDPMDNAYYPLPFTMTLVVWEVLARGRAPVLAAAVTVALWLGQHRIAPFTSPDVQAAFFAVWSVPITVWLGIRLYGPGMGLHRRGAVGQTV